MGEKTKDIKAIFWQAVEKENREEQLAYLEEACRDDAETRAKVEELLQAHEEAKGFLDIPPFVSDVILDDSPLTEGSGTVIDKYKLLEKIGEGGMAVVYMAEQQEPIRRKVALKIIKLGMDTKSVITRFEAERQALAMMDHPNIAKVLDAGATETGRPYFVMELVTGVSITEYCDKNNLSTRDRLALFIQVCNAVQHAHQKGIIHRDIKPTNVMVAQHEGKPVPKVIDFGIAKATKQRLTEKTLFTRYAHIIGTPVYMSPEQAELSDVDIDTRSDIYSLGVLLYELLTGTTPFSEEELHKAGYIEMQRVIREQEPAKPSTKLSTLGDTLTDVAKHRNSNPDVLAKAIRGDLDWIVMKSLEKDRTRRYETANGLGMDVQRHLDSEPVLARGPNAVYRLQKFLRRNRVTAVTFLVIAVVIAVVGVILSEWNEDRRLLEEAEDSQHRSILLQARQQYAEANRDAALETIKPILNSKHVGPEAQLLNAGILVDSRRSDEATTILGDLLDERPEIAGAAHSLLARILWENASPDVERLQEIEEHRQKAELMLPETAEAYFLRAMTAMTVKEQLTSLDEALHLDPDHYESRRLRAFTYYASRKYERLRDDALVMTVLRRPDPLGYSLRAIALRELGKYTEAITEYDNAIARIAKDDPQYVDLSSQRCEVLLRMGDYERLIRDTRECITLSPDRPVFQYYTFAALTALGDYEKADSVFQEIASRSPTSRNEFRDWCAKYIFDTLEAGRPWHPEDREPTGAAFLPMVEAEETYRSLSAKAHRLTTDGFNACWSPEKSKLAFSAGVLGYSGIAVYDLATKETELLIVPGKDPRWSPDGKYIVFVRDCHFLRISEFIALEPRDQRRLQADEEVWIMESDGADPRHLIRGGSPSWSRDSTRVYYHSRLDNALCSISIKEREAKPKQIMKCYHDFPAISPDEKCVAYVEDARLKVKDLTSQTVIAQWPILPTMWGDVAWSPTGQELCLGGAAEQTGLWIYSLGKPQPARVLDGRIGSGLWSLDGTKFALRLGSAHSEIWTANLELNVSTTEALGPGQTPDEHFQRMLAFYARRIEADPQDAYAYSNRAHYYDCLHDKAKANADMRRWSTTASGKSPPDFQATIPQNIRLGTQSARADFTFGEPINLGPNINSPDGERMGCISPDGLELYFTTPDRPGGFGGTDIWVAKRHTAEDAWGTVANLGSVVNSDSSDGGVPCISADGLKLYFCSDRPGGSGGLDIWVTIRDTTQDDWGWPVNLGPTINSPYDEFSPSISSDGLLLFFSDLDATTLMRPGGYGQSDIWVATRATKGAPWSEPVNLGPVVNSAEHDTTPSLSADGLTLVFGRGSFWVADIWMTRRKTIDAAWEAPIRLGLETGSDAWGGHPDISFDGSTIYWTSWKRAGGFGAGDIWQASISPLVDSNGDGIVDSADMCIMIEHWLTDYPLCDIGPMRWSDGIVDVQDLIVKKLQRLFNKP